MKQKTQRTDQPQQPATVAARAGGPGAKGLAPAGLENLSNSVNASAPVQRLQAAQHRADANVIQRAGGLPQDLRSGIESLSGLSMDGVRVHHNSAEPARIGAHAYAQGKDIHLGPGQDQHLPHEAWHVVQQAQGRVQPTLSVNGTAVNDSPALEAEADRMGARALQRQAIGPVGGQTSLRALPAFAAPVQAKFGFEIETQIMALAMRPRTAEEIAEGTFSFLPADGGVPTGPVLADGDGFTVHLDHNTNQFAEVPGNESGTIIELVTDPPFDEATETEAEVVAKIGKMARTAEEFEANADAPAPIENYSNIVSSKAMAGHAIYPGSLDGSSHGQSAKGYVQVTFGAKLASVPLAMEYLAQDSIVDKGFAPNKTQFTESISVSKEIADELLALVKPHIAADVVYPGEEAAPLGWERKQQPMLHYHHHETDTHEFDRPSEHDIIEHDLRELRGLLALLSKYLVAGKRLTGGERELVKNRIGQVFYKTSLATVRNQLRGYAKMMVDHADYRKILEDKLIEKLALTRTAQVIPLPDGSGLTPPTVQQYIRDVLSGTGDWIFSKFKNPWSNELIDTVGETGRQAPAVVMENRKARLPKTPAERHREMMAAIAERGAGDSKKGGVPPAQWAEFARHYYRVLKALNAPTPKKPS